MNEIYWLRLPVINLLLFIVLLIGGTIEEIYLTFHPNERTKYIKSSTFQRFFLNMEAPEKIYLFENPISGYPDDRWLSSRSGEDDVEYTRSDAFFDKVWDWIEDNIMSTNQRDESLLYFEQFKNCMKGE